MDVNSIDLIEYDPVRAAIAIKTDITELRRGHRQNLYHCVARVYKVACAMASDEKSWLEFREQAFWNKRNKRPGVNSRNEALLHVMVFAFNATSKNAYDRAWKYARALRKSFEKKVPAERIEAVIEENGGLEKMMQVASGKHKGDKKGARAAREGSSSDDAIGADEDADAGNEANENQERMKSKPEKGDRKDKSERSRGGEKKHKPLKAPPRKYQFIATKSCGPKLRRLDKNQKARVTIEMVVRDRQLIPRIIGVHILNG